MNLSELQVAAETAKTNAPGELELWQMGISPDDVLRLVEVARAAKIAQAVMLDDKRGLRVLDEALEGIE